MIVGAVVVLSQRLEFTGRAVWGCPVWGPRVLPLPAQPQADEAWVAWETFRV